MPCAGRMQVLWVFWLVLASLLAGCASGAPAFSEHPSPIPQNSPTTTGFPTGTPLPAFTPTLTLLPPHPAVTPDQSSIPAPPVEFRVCTPLLDHPLDELRLIVSDPYRPPPGKSDARHHGVDFSYYRFKERDTIQGVGVQAVIPGQVIAALADSFPFGNLVIVETASELIPAELGERLGAQPGDSLYLLYAHMDGAPTLRIGDRVQSCQSLGAVGKSGNAVEPHLHLETRLGPAGTVFTGLGEYFPEASPEERAAYKLWRTSGVYRHLDPMVLINFGLELQ